MDGGGDRLEGRVLHPSNVAIIREIYDGPDSQDIFVMELEKALESCCTVIVIEPSQLGDETARWITAGNYLHKMAVISGFSSLITENIQNNISLLQYNSALPHLQIMNMIQLIAHGIQGFVWPQNFIPQAPLAIFSVLCTGLYTASWQFDHCVKYQVERESRKLARLPILSALTAASPVVLVRKDDTRKKILHCTVSLAAAAMCVYKLYGSVK